MLDGLTFHWCDGEWRTAGGLRLADTLPTIQQKAQGMREQLVTLQSEIARAELSLHPPCAVCGHPATHQGPDSSLPVCDTHLRS